MSDEDRGVVIGSAMGLAFSILAALLWHAGHEAWTILILAMYVSGIYLDARCAWDYDTGTYLPDQTAEDAAVRLRELWPMLAAVHLDVSKRWLRVIEAPSLSGPVERYRIMNLGGACRATQATSMGMWCGCAWSSWA